MKTLPDDNQEQEQPVAPPPSPEPEEMDIEERLDAESQFAWGKY